MATIEFPSRRIGEDPIIDVFCRALVSLNHYDIIGHGPIPRCAKETILVFFHHEEWKVWVSIPYWEARRRLPQLPDLPKEDDVDEQVESMVKEDDVEEQVES